MRSTKPSSEIHSLIQRYLNHLSLERRYSDNTVLAVRRDLLCIDVPLLQANTAQLKTTLGKRHAAGAAPRSLARMASSWRGFYAYLVQEGLLAVNPAESLKTPKLPKALPKAVGVDLLAALLDGPEPPDLRMKQAKVLIELLYSTGLRISEALSLALDTPSDTPNARSSLLSISTREIRVFGKGGKIRVVPLIDSVVESLKSFLLVRQAHLLSLEGAKQSALFVSATGKRLSPRQAQLDVSAFAKHRGLGQHLHPHMLRHSFGSHVLQSTQNLRAVQELLGHASLSSTQVYTALDFSHLSSVYDKAFPRAK